MEPMEIEGLVRKVIEEYVQRDQSKSEPAHKAELEVERRRREEMEARLNDLIEENRRAKGKTEETERQLAIRSELERLGVQKVDLALRAVRDDVTRTEDGRLVANSGGEVQDLRQYLAKFINENPEFLPARIEGGSGQMGGEGRGTRGSGPIDLERIKPGMSREEMERARQEIARIASQTLRGL